MINIYSIDEILKATNNLLKPKAKTTIKKKETEVPPNIENIIREGEKTLILAREKKQNTETPLVLKNEIPLSKTINSFNYKIKIKPNVKEHMINELYTYLKKKIKKNTLKLIIEEQVEIRNLNNKINFLKQNENKLKNSYQILKDNYELALNNNEILKIDNNVLQNNLKQVINDKELLDIKNKKLIIHLKELKLNLEESLGKNKLFKVNNSELKNTISTYILNYKKLQEKINLLENSKNLKFDDEIKKVKFYQDENIRLSSELIFARKKNETIKENLNNIEFEKEKISNKIKELNKSIEGKSNIVPSSFIKEIPDKAEKNINKLNDTEEKNLDEVINRIFNKT
tara:strand:- start:184 stop:1212 length:1029 start_codon:yes stop_codon:yes gene_type:complete